MEMPAFCDECPVIDNYGYCKLIKRCLCYDERENEVPKACPLIEEPKEKSCFNCKYEEGEDWRCNTCEPPGYGTNWEWEESE